jgi:hypothetical protein
LLPDCPTCEKYLKERKVKKEAHEKYNMKECISVVNVIDVYPIKIHLEEESQSSSSTVSPKHIYIESPTVRLLSLDDLLTPQLSTFEDNEFDIDDFNFDLDYRPEWEYSLEDTDILSFGSCEGMPPLYGPRRDDSSPGDSYATRQRNNDNSV